ncbi:Crp/Fnr family transcriptional regulator [Pedobacter sp. KBS0701]|uniref:Crp/Fnr family transcriptional regulator n=1 Tax=Pedobacter sp. KBS0701 TaxID=2578106 RepID=UPI001AEFCBBF|nr:Crp/Fnr family transcriptional regulator [Pedobacter sp. KBS0701]
MTKGRLIDFFNQGYSVSPVIYQQIAEHFTYKKLAKGEFQLLAEKVCNEYFFLEKGYMRAFVRDTESNEVTTNFYTPGQMVFEVSSFFKRGKSKENIHVLSECEGWFITFSQLNELFHTIPEFRDFGRSILVQGFSELKSRMLSMITETAEQRYIELLKSNPVIFQHAPLKNIASFLGITDTSLSRIRKDFAKRR